MSLVDITVEELKQKLDQKEEFVFIDVREVHEYQDFNLGAQLIPLGDLPAKLPELDPYKEKEIVIHCRSGARSGNAKQYMLQHGYKNVKNLLGGVLDWQEKFGLLYSNKSET